MSSDEVGRYRDSLSAVQEQARAYVEASIRALVALNPDLSVAELREYGSAVLEQAMRVYGDQSCALACMEYDDVARELGYDLAPAEIFNDVDLARIDRDSRYLAGLIESRGVEEYARRMASKARDHVLFSANRTMGANAARERDRESGMRYARVPSGRETCGFCLMLASQGFVYSSAKAAGQRGGLYNSFHSHCDCTVMPGDEFTEIDGYDPDWLLEVYQDARAAVEHDARAAYDAAGGEDGTGKKYDKFLRDRIAKEIEARDRDWAWTGKTCSVSKEPGAKPWKKERGVADALVPHGFNVRFVRELKDSKIFDAYLNGLPWEFKVPEEWNEKTVKNQFKKAIGKGTNRLLISGGMNGATMEDMAAQVSKIFSSDDFEEITEVLLLDASGAIRRMLRQENRPSPVS